MRHGGVNARLGRTREERRGRRRSAGIRRSKQARTHPAELLWLVQPKHGDEETVAVPLHRCPHEASVLVLLGNTARSACSVARQCRVTSQLLCRSVQGATQGAGRLTSTRFAFFFLAAGTPLEASKIS